MTFIVETAKGPIKIVAPTALTSSVRRPIGLATAKKLAKAFGVDYRRFV